MQWLNRLCGVAATLAAWGAPLSAQEIGDSPSPQAAMAAYRAVDGWVRAWHVGKVEVFRPEDPQVPTCIAASVTLRLGGEVIGRGVEVAANDAARQSIVAAATRAALDEAEPKLGVPRDAMYQATVRDVAKRLTISVQLAGDLIPISPKDAAEALDMVAPGVEGVGARLGDRVAVNFPERMLTGATEPGPALGTLVGRLADDASLAVLPLAKLAKDNGVVFYRFRVTHLAQPKSGDTPVFLSRCGRVIRRSEMDEAELRRWADALAAWLLSRRSGGQTGALFARDLNPVQGDTDKNIADPVVQLICAEALSHWKNLSRSAPEADQAISAVYSDLLADNELKEKILRDPAAAALLASELNTAGLLGDAPGAASFDPAFRELCWSVVRKCFDPEKGFNPKLQPSERAIVCYGLLTPPIESTETMSNEIASARAAISRAYADAEPGGLPALMPWLGHADYVLSGVEHRRSFADLQERLATPLTAGPLASAAALREMRSKLWQHQLQPDAIATDQQDLAGGIAFSASRSVMPTWHMARPLAFVATMLGDPRLTNDAEFPEELLRLLASLRFLRQLTAGEAESFMYKNPERAIGGVRSSLWDQRMPPEATAMTLLTVCETLRSMEEIRKRRENEPRAK